MSTVKVEVKIDSKGDAAYLFGNEYYGVGFGSDHSEARATRCAQGFYTKLSNKASSECDLPYAPVIHTYEVTL